MENENENENNKANEMNAAEKEKDEIIKTRNKS